MVKRIVFCCIVLFSLGRGGLFDKQEINNISRNALDLGSGWETYMIRSCQYQYFASGILSPQCKLSISYFYYYSSNSHDSSNSSINCSSSHS